MEDGRPSKDSFHVHFGTGDGCCENSNHHTRPEPWSRRCSRHRGNWFGQGSSCSDAAVAVALDVRCRGILLREEIQYTIHSSVVSLRECCQGKKDTTLLLLLLSTFVVKGICQGKRYNAQYTCQWCRCVSVVKGRKIHSSSRQGGLVAAGVVKYKEEVRETKLTQHY